MTSTKKEDSYYRAMLARDPRFDGKFFVAVKTTGIYCRPICPAKPKRENVEFFASAIEAEKAGYRPCLRCRPESAPRSPAWIGKSAVVQRAIKVLNSMETIGFNENRFADQFGVTARHLRRLFVDELGKTPKQLSFELRLNLARKLIVETQLPMTEVAFAAGFSSIRRFNDGFRDRFKRAPRDIRRQRPARGQDDALRISLPYRPPFDFEGLRKTYERHRVGNLEWFADGKMWRVVAMNGQIGQISIANRPKTSSLILEIDFPDASAIHHIITRVRNLPALDSDPIVVANCLEADPEIKRILKASPGIRLLSGWDPFEVAIGTILGQFVSVEYGRELVHDLIELAGKDARYAANGKAVKLFPTPREIMKADLTSLRTTKTRKRTLIEFSRAVHEKTISLEPTQDVDEFIRRVSEVHGIGTWTANNMALRALRSTDTFPASDLILARALEKHPAEIVAKMSPWRGYVAALFWRTYAETLKKTKRKKTA